MEMAKRNEFPPDWDLTVPIDEIRLPAAKLLEIARPDSSGLREFEVLPLPFPLLLLCLTIHSNADLFYEFE